jgi:hypothetical protein
VTRTRVNNRLFQGNGGSSYSGRYRIRYLVRQADHSARPLVRSRSAQATFDMSAPVTICTATKPSAECLISFNPSRLLHSMHFRSVTYSADPVILLKHVLPIMSTAYIESIYYSLRASKTFVVRYTWHANHRFGNTKSISRCSTCTQISLSCSSHKALVWRDT